MDIDGGYGKKSSDIQAQGVADLEREILPAKAENSHCDNEGLWNFIKCRGWAGYFTNRLSSITKATTGAAFVIEDQTN